MAVTMLLSRKNELSELNLDIVSNETNFSPKLKPNWPHKRVKTTQLKHDKKAIDRRSKYEY